MELELTVSAANSTDEELDQLTRNLLGELRDLNIETVSLARERSTPHGTKGDPVTLGALALVVLPTAIPSLIALTQAWMLRGAGRTIKFKGKGFTFEGPPDEFRKYLKLMEAQK
jgi:hypothetical protein